MKAEHEAKKAASAKEREESERRRVETRLLREQEEFENAKAREAKEKEATTRKEELQKLVQEATGKPKDLIEAERAAEVLRPKLKLLDQENMQALTREEA